MTTKHVAERRMFFFWFRWFSLVQHTSNSQQHFMNASNCRISYLATSAPIANVVRQFGETSSETGEQNLRTRDASGIKIQATNGHIHSNRYLLISGFITSRDQEKKWKMITDNWHGILSFYLRTCSSCTHTRAGTEPDSARCEFDNYIFLRFILSGVLRASCIDRHNRMKFNTSVYR